MRHSGRTRAAAPVLSMVVCLLLAGNAALAQIVTTTITTTTQTTTTLVGATTTTTEVGATTTTAVSTTTTSSTTTTTLPPAIRCMNKLLTRAGDFARNRMVRCFRSFDQRARRGRPDASQRLADCITATQENLQARNLPSGCPECSSSDENRSALAAGLGTIFRALATGFSTTVDPACPVTDPVWQSQKVAKQTARAYSNLLKVRRQTARAEYASLASNPSLDVDNNPLTSSLAGQTSEVPQREEIEATWKTQIANNSAVRSCFNRDTFYSTVLEAGADQSIRAAYCPCLYGAPNACLDNCLVCNARTTCVTLDIPRCTGQNVCLENFGIDCRQEPITTPCDLFQCNATGCDGTSRAKCCQKDSFCFPTSGGLPACVRSGFPTASGAICSCTYTCTLGCDYAGCTIFQ